MTSGERFHEPRSLVWRHGATPVIGLTGGVASGKSAVAALLAEHGFAVIDADKVGHLVLDLPRSPAEARRSLRKRRVLIRHRAFSEPRVDRRHSGRSSLLIRRLGVHLKRSFIL